MLKVMSTRHRLCLLRDVPPGSARECVAGDRIIAIFNVEGQLHAIDGICPHAGGPLADGELQGCIVTCPWHGWQFDVSTGRHMLTPRIQQTRFPVIVEDEQVFIELP